MKRKNIFKGTILATGFAVFITAISPVTSVFADDSTSPIVVSEQDKTTPESIKDYINNEDQPTNVTDIRDFIQYASTTPEFQNYIGEDQENVVHSSGVVGGTLKAIKVFGWFCRVGGKTLKYAIKPLSPSKAKLVDHYARYIARATEKLNSGTKSALVKALKSVGVPGNAAESLAEIILWLV